MKFGKLAVLSKKKKKKIEREREFTYNKKF